MADRLKANIATYTFPRGIHPREGKELSQKCAIEILPTPEELWIPLSQHIGMPSKQCVKLREELAFGQVVGEADGFVSAPVVTSLQGTVKKVSAVTLPNGHRVSALVVTTKGAEFDTASLLEQYKHLPEFQLTDFAPETILERIKSAGLVGQGGATFPLHVKLSPGKDKPIDTLLVNGCECEPYLTADHRAMLEMPETVLAGARLAAKVVKAKRVVICIEANKPDAIEKMLETVATWSARRESGEAEIEVVRMKTKYPQGGEKQLIYAALRRKVPLGKLPMDVGAVVVNVGTSVSLAVAVVLGLPLTHRIVTVTGGGIVRPANLFVPIGTPISKLIEYCGGFRNARRVLSGGPMMGFALGSLDVPVTKGTSGITVLSDAELARTKQTNCIRCGRCVSACPMHLIPSRLMLASRAQNWEAFEEYHPMACIECGCCSFSCPAKIPIVQLIRVGKKELVKAKKKG